MVLLSRNDTLFTSITRLRLESVAQRWRVKSHVIVDEQCSAKSKTVLSTKRKESPTRDSLYRSSATASAHRQHQACASIGHSHCIHCAHYKIIKKDALCQRLRSSQHNHLLVVTGEEHSMTLSKVYKKRV